ncbi:ATP-binding protein [Streptomyces sp. NPDC059649]|uniref:ATP-binding protein n=1 Tax=Streptomyces sp. NPDC059649 TaxID=3346895 RepID=UPI0036C4BE85
MLESSSPSTWRIALPREATAVPIARAMVRCALQDLGSTADRTTAQLLTAELVTNALKHTSADHPIELVVERGPDGCRVEVHDGDTVLVEGLGEPLPLPLPLPVPLPTPTSRPTPTPTPTSVPTSMRTSMVGSGEPRPMTGTGATLPSAEPGDVALATTDPRAGAEAGAGTGTRNRGLLLVRSLSSGSGCRRTRHGKAVWFTLPELHPARQR